MKKIIVFLVLALTSPFATSGAVGGVVTVTQFGPYINCVVNNNTQYNIVVKQTAYNVTGSQGNAHSVFDCTSNCVVDVFISFARRFSIEKVCIPSICNK